MLQIAKNLRLIREDVLEISRNTFAEYLNIPGVTHHTLQNFEAERTTPKESIVNAIAMRVGIDPNDLKNKRLTKKDIPVIVIEKTTTQASSEPIDKVLEEKNQLIQSLQKQIEQQQKVIEILTKQDA